MGKHKVDVVQICLWVLVAVMIGIGILAIAGCSGWNPFIQTESTKKAENTSTATLNDELKSQIGPSLAPSASGEGAKAITAIGDKAIAQLGHVYEHSVGQTTTEKKTVSLLSSTGLTLIGIAVGIGLLALVVWLIWRYVKTTGVYAAAKVAVAPLIVRIKDWQARKAETADPAVLARANEEIARLNSEAADIRKALGG